MPAINGHRLRELSVQAGLSHAKLAKAADCSSVHVQNIIAGRKTPGIALVHRLAAAVGCPVADLLTEPLPDTASPLRQRRRAAGIRVHDLARLVGISAEHLNNIEAGRRGPSQRVLAELATALGCTPDDIVRDAA